MIADPTYLAAFLLGLFGGVHCIGMCGGIVTLLAVGGGTPVQERASATFSRLLGYNLGRLTSYLIAAALLGGFAELAIHLADLHAIQRGLYGVVGGLMIAMGLYLGGWWPGFARLETVGVPVWNRLQPIAQRLLPAANFKQALMVGAVWGWVPCGLVYTVLIWAIASGSVSQAVLLMACFGLGTLPNLMLMGGAATRLSLLLRQVWVRRVGGLVVIGFGLYALYGLLS